jgi:hypothetical protein
VDGFAAISQYVGAQPPSLSSSDHLCGSSTTDGFVESKHWPEQISRVYSRAEDCARSLNDPSK